ncbi:hypothetical protein PBR31_00060 [Xanthomonas phage PBR31]|uniref:Uncharacterized protein n=1 Tax=Xanthomonas phage PPDBI TaxID=2723911 RepID=A0A6H0X5V8_9CAUD|nr:hypothetical protein [Ralstonia pickettii]NYS09352.1 hypothetical protein [Ralstonia pickettii]QIN95371.1 hypothetical protein PBR31_00060 [Xanthomonas phage PBR31]QIW89419.1 hypothetical protein PPDBI_00060 [Xanthomonas phage PPDBI]
MKPKIYAFSNVVGGGDGPAYAMAEDGTVLGSHWCSNESYVLADLGVTEGARPDRHKTYAEHYPDGYEMEFVASRDVPSHAGLQAAFALNQEKAKADAAAQQGA